MTEDTVDTDREKMVILVAGKTVVEPSKRIKYPNERKCKAVEKTTANTR